MSEKITIDILRLARQMAKDRAKGIGEPLIHIPNDYLFVRDADGSVTLHMRMDHFITLAEDYATPPKS